MLQPSSEGGELNPNPIVAEDNNNLQASGSTSNGSASLEILQPSGSASDGSIPLKNQGPTVRKSKRGNIPRQRFEVEGSVYFCVSMDEEEPTSYKEV